MKVGIHPDTILDERRIFTIYYSITEHRPVQSKLTDPNQFISITMLFEFLQNTSMNTNILQLFLTPEFYMGFVTALAGERGVKRYMQSRSGYRTNSNNSNSNNSTTDSTSGQKFTKTTNTPQRSPQPRSRSKSQTAKTSNNDPRNNDNTEESSNGYIREEPRRN